MKEAREAATDALRGHVAAHDWYHTIDLAPGVVTPGWFDTRAVVAQVPLPRDLTGKRCLDVGTFDGFWAFELERRGAAEVVAIDVLDPNAWDWPANSSPDAISAIGGRKANGVGFELAREALGSMVKRHELSVYDVDTTVIGTFDLVYLGSLLLHLQDPVRALQAISRVCGDELVVVDAVDARLTKRWPRRAVAELDALGRPWWWKPNAAALVRMIQAAGFEVCGPPTMVRMPRGAGQLRPPLRPGTLRSREARVALGRWYRGDPHAALVARPRRRQEGGNA
jgi:tRNA (mo5U34)-methyltransferase